MEEAPIAKKVILSVTQVPGTLENESSGHYSVYTLTCCVIQEDVLSHVRKINVVLLSWKHFQNMIIHSVGQ
jgi:hypothetical protein